MEAPRTHAPLPHRAPPIHAGAHRPPYVTERSPDVHTLYGGGFYDMAAGTGASQIVTVMTFTPPWAIFILTWRMEFYVSTDKAVEVPTAGIGYFFRLGHSMALTNLSGAVGAGLSDAFWEVVPGILGTTRKFERSMRPFGKRVGPQLPITCEIQYARTNGAAAVVSGFEAHVVIDYAAVPLTLQAPST